jgi:hypothetical protein
MLVDVPFSRLTPKKARPQLPHAGHWEELSTAVRAFDPDVVVLVARKMPRLLEALSLDFGPGVLCISDQAIPFSATDLRDARVAIVDDVWNYGSTMLRARDRVQLAQPRATRMFAIGAREVARADAEGVELVVARRLQEQQYRALVDSVPHLLRQLPKPYDADFPLVRCLLQPGFNDWSVCWNWLSQTFGSGAHSVTGVEQLDAGVARATITLPRPGNWAVKARLYFDFNTASCNVVPMALAPVLPLANDYPAKTMASSVFDALAELILGAEDVRGGHVDAKARLNTFCDSLLVRDEVVALLGGLLSPESVDPFSITDVETQFGRRAGEVARRLLQSDDIGSASGFLPERANACSPSFGATASPSVSVNLYAHAIFFLSEGFAVRAMEALFEGLGKAVGADDPEQYCLEEPFSPSEIVDDPYLRLRIGFTYRDILTLFVKHFSPRFSGPDADADGLVSMLIDLFIDQGAIVPTFSYQKEECRRVYRKGEANRSHDDDVERLSFALSRLGEKRQDVIERHRTRVAKIMAIMAFAGRTGNTVSAGPLERGTVGMLMPSVVERNAFELTGYMRRIGQWR